MHQQRDIDSIDLASCGPFMPQAGEMRDGDADVSTFIGLTAHWPTMRE